MRFSSYQKIYRRQEQPEAFEIKPLATHSLIMLDAFIFRYFFRKCLMRQNTAPPITATEPIVAQRTVPILHSFQGQLPETVNVPLSVIVVFTQASILITCPIGVSTTSTVQMPITSAGLEEVDVALLIVNCLSLTVDKMQCARKFLAFEIFQ